MEYDEICFKELLEENLLDVLYHLHNEGYLMDNVAKIMIAAGSKFIKDDEFEVDWDNLVVRTKNPMANTTYSLFIYLDLGKVHEVEQKIHTRNEFGKGDNTITDTTI